MTKRKKEVKAKDCDKMSHEELMAQLALHPAMAGLTTLMGLHSDSDLPSISKEVTTHLA